jgi:hypothetical protein
LAVAQTPTATAVSGGGPPPQLLRDPGQPLLPLSIRIAERYVAPELAQQFGERNAVGGELLVRLHPEKITGFGDMTS